MLHTFAIWILFTTFGKVYIYKNHWQHSESSKPLCNYKNNFSNNHIYPGLSTSCVCSQFWQKSLLILYELGYQWSLTSHTVMSGPYWIGPLSIGFISCAYDTNIQAYPTNHWWHRFMPIYVGFAEFTEFTGVIGFTRFTNFIGLTNFTSVTNFTDFNN